MVDVDKALAGGASRGSKDEVPPNILLQKLMGRDAPSEVLPFPRNGADGKPLFEYRMRVLTQFELDGCTVDAEEYTSRQFKTKKPTDEELGAVRGEAWSEVFNNAKIVEVLLRACKQIEPKTKADGTTYYEPLFRGGDELRKLLTGDELAALFNAYANVQFKFGKSFRMLDDSEVDALVDRLEEGLDGSPLSHLEPGQLIVLVASLAARNRILRTDIGSSGGPAESGTSETSESGNE